MSRGRRAGDGSGSDFDRTPRQPKSEGPGTVATDLRIAIFEEFKRDPTRVNEAVIGELLPLARSLRLVSKSETLEAIVQRILLGESEAFEVDPAKPEPKKLAGLAFSGVLSGLLLAAESRLFNEDDSEFTLGVLRRLPEVRGYMRAMMDMQALRASKGAEARRALGAGSSFAVWTAALEHRGRRSKEQAAPLIAQKVNLSAATVRRMLIAQFPGRRWANPGSDESADLA